MASKITVTRTDDLNPALDAETTVEFGIDGVNFEIDLTHKNADKLREALQPWISAARKTSGRHRGGRRITAGTPSNKEELREIRQWAASNGIKVSSRGRISQEIRAQFHAATKPDRVDAAVARAEAKLARQESADAAE